MLPQPIEPGNPAQEPSRAHYRFLVRADGPSFETWRIMPDGRFLAEWNFTGRFLGLPIMDLPHVEVIDTDETVPFGMTVVKIAARAAGVPEILNRYRRQPDGLFHCPHCASKCKTNRGFSQHLKRHGDHGGEIFAWYSAVPAWDADVA